MNQNKIVKIGSRDSELATWQAKEVQTRLASKHISSEIVFIKSHGDLVQDKPLSELGTVGVFTKVLDDALLAGEIDIAVHSCKDLPTQLPTGICLASFLEREDHRDVLVSNQAMDFSANRTMEYIFATGSVRRKAQLLAQFPNATVVGLRGNVPTRLQKLKNNTWHAAVFALAGLKRLAISPQYMYIADFMVSAPAQGIVAIACREEDEQVYEHLRLINQSTSERAAQIEREFLQLMEGGCISPIGAYASILEDSIDFTCSVLSVDGKESVSVHINHPLEEWQNIAQIAFEQACKEGAKSIIDQIEHNA